MAGSRTGSRAPQVRAAGACDAAACARVYAPYVRETAITFEEEAPGAMEMAERIERSCLAHAWLVIEDATGVFGYAYGARLHPRPAYRWSCEVSVYIDRSHHGRGGGRRLYGELLRVLGDRGYRVAVAGITLPNPASAALHRSFGFEPVGTYRSIGFKLGAWHDVQMLELRLGGEGPPGELR